MVKRRPFDKYFDKGLKIWIVRTAKKNYWRVASYHDLDDLIAEGYLSYAICNARYRDRVKNKRHFMGLCKMIYLNRITDMANARTRGEEFTISQIIDESVTTCELALEEMGGWEKGDAELQAALATAPQEIQALMRLLSDPAALSKLQKPDRRLPGRHRQTTSQRLCAMIGIEYVDLEAMLRGVLGLA